MAGHAQETPVVSLSFGYIYLNAGQNGASRVSLNGWYAIPQYHLSTHWSAIAELTNFYGTTKGHSTNIHGYTFGPVYSFHALGRVTPFAFGEAGDVRTSAAGVVANNFAFVAGAGINIKIAGPVALQIIPGDYILTTPDAGVLHNYAAQAGLAIDLWRK